MRDAAAGVERQVAAAHHRREGGLGAPGQRTNPRDQLRESERLGQVVVRAQAEPSDPILDPRRSGQHQHARASALADECLADPVAVNAWKVTIEHDHVVVVDRGMPQPGRAVERDVDGHAVALQAERDRLGQLSMVLDHQHAHSACKQSSGSPTTASQDRRVQVTPR